MLNLFKKFRNLISKNKIIYSGKNSRVIRLNNKNILKIFTRKKEIKYFIEKKCLLELKEYDYFPNIIEFNDNLFQIEMSYCGSKISRKNLPKNWKKQVSEIKKILDNQTFVQSDIELHNICIDNEKIYLIDFGSNRFLDDEFFYKDNLQPNWLKSHKVSAKEKYNLYKSVKHSRLEILLKDLSVN